MRTSLSCECGRAADRPRGRGPLDCAGERTRDRLGPRFATAVVGRGTIGRGPVAVSAWLVATLLATRTRREVVERFLASLNIQVTKCTKKTGGTKGTEGQSDIAICNLPRVLHSLRGLRGFVVNIRI